MISLEQSIKKQYSKIFCVSDWLLFKQTSEAQLKEAVHLKKPDMRFEVNHKLLARNSRKRLLIGIGIELLLKAIYLKNGYGINKPKTSHNNGITFPYLIAQVNNTDLDPTNTFTLSKLIDKLTDVVELPNSGPVIRGLNIAKVFRNKEGHIVAAVHEYDSSNYRDIEYSLTALYEHGFYQRLDINFSISPGEQAIWNVYPF
ncbi:hypothetical protein [Methylocaldum sp.]|uniref:hypothetical protein n=1 Tax=Methylocaldum sp. TaxID=1969727 RepID=UPI002D3EF897|nr:hypothetical protein [Methylocaldum sp.]HYE34636.1 hypothetical protein [Methylocaldum sp.]